MCNYDNLKDNNNLKNSNNLKCKYCGSNRINNSSKVNNGNQRYLYRDCKRTFTITRKKYSEEYKLKIIKMYLENIPNTTVLKWIRNFGKIIKERMIEEVNNIPDNIKDVKENIEVLEIDEIVTYVKKFKNNQYVKNRRKKFYLHIDCY